MHESRVGVRDLTVHAQRIFHVQFVLIKVVDEVLGKRDAIAKALYGRVHEASVTKIRETAKTGMAGRLPCVVFVVAET